MLRSFLLIPLFLGISSAPAQQTVHIIAHRGASAYAPENTLAAFAKAVDFGADILELDVRQTRDGELVVLHDASVNRTTNGKGRVADLTLEQIKALDAGSWFSPDFVGERVPTLAEVVDATPDFTTLLVELKGSPEEYPGMEARVVRFIRQRGIEKRVILKSFERDVLNRLRMLAPDIPRLRIVVSEISFLGLIIGHGVHFGSVFEDDVQYLQHHWFSLTEGFIRKAHDRGYKVFAWDVDDEKRMEELIKKGIDGIETDHPDWTGEILRRKFRTD
jgi:glycerophosphoryl diester phosphodiesterase